MAEQRKFERLPARLEVEIRSRGRGQVCPSANVSRHGMFLLTPNPPHERQLLILRIPLPDGQAPFDVMASVVRRTVLGTESAAEATPGVGVNFFALTETNKVRWEGYLATLRGMAQPKSTLAPEDAHRPTFLLQPKDPDRLRLFQAREFALGSMFLRTPVLHALGETLKVILLHPLSDAEFPLLATVRTQHQGKPTGTKGMTLDFLAVDHETRLAFIDFVEHGVGLDEDPAFMNGAIAGAAARDGGPSTPAGARDDGRHEGIGEAFKDFPGAKARPSADTDALLAQPELVIPALPIEEVLGEELQVETAAPPPPPPDVGVEAESDGAASETTGPPTEPEADEPTKDSPRPRDPPWEESTSTAAETEEPGASEAGSEAAASELGDDLTPTGPLEVPEPGVTALTPELTASEASPERSDVSETALPSGEQDAESKNEPSEAMADDPASPGHKKRVADRAAQAQLEELRVVLEGAPEDLGSLFQLGSRLARTPGTAYEAIGLLQRLLALEPQHPLGNGSLALAYAQIGQRAAAQRHLARARRLGQPVDSQLLSLLG